MTRKIYSTVHADLPKIVLMRRYGIATLIKCLFLEDKVVRIEFCVADCVETVEQRRPKLTSRKRRRINSRTHMYLFLKVSRVVLRGVWFRE